jgi:hypothetical protein
MTLDSSTPVERLAYVLVKVVERTGKRIERAALAPLGFKSFLNDLDSLRKL